MTEILSLPSQLPWRIRRSADDLAVELLHRSPLELGYYQLAKIVEPSLFFWYKLGEDFFQQLQQVIGQVEKTVVDIGAGRNFLRGVAFLNATNIVAVDPAYQWYEYQPTMGEKNPYPDSVFSGRAEKEKMTKLLKISFKNLKIPTRIKGVQTHIISGVRHGEKRVFQLLPVDAGGWIDKQPAQSFPNLIVWRVFPSPPVWGKILDSLKIGGVLMTTGLGNLEFRPEETIVCGADIDNTPLPKNGRCQTIGLQPLTDLPNIYFYRKTAHLPPEKITEAIRLNL